MTRSTRHLGGRWLCPAVAAGIVLSWNLCTAHGQGRGRVTLSRMRLSNIGQGTSLNAFQEYSYGLSGATSPSSGPLGGGGGGVLRSNIAGRGLRIKRSNKALGMQATGFMPAPQRPTTSIRRSVPNNSRILRGGAYNLNRSVTKLPIAPSIHDTLRAAGATARLPATGIRADESNPSFIGEQRGPGIGAMLAGQDRTAFGATRAYLRALEEAFVSQLRDANQPMTNLIPSRPSVYQEHMAKGDQAFRSGNYHGAYIEFRIANDLGNQDPESFICLAHAQFAVSRFSYAKASYFLQRALEKLPELPLANLRPEGFYGSADKYADHLVALQEHLERDPTDGEALLVLAYFRWFGKARAEKATQAAAVEATKKALGAAIASATRSGRPELSEAIETFWRGMVQSGEVSGELKPGPADPSLASGDATAIAGPGDRPPAP